MLLGSLINFYWLELVYIVELFNIFKAIFDFTFIVIVK